MGTLQATLDSLLQNYTKPQKIAAILFERKLKEKGIVLTEAQSTEIESQLLNLPSDRITINVDDGQLIRLNPKLREGIKDLHLDLRISENDIEDLLAQVTKGWSEALPRLVDDLSKLLLKQLRKNAASLLRNRKKDRTSFETRLGKRWRKPLKLLEMFLAIALEAGDNFNREFRAKAAEENDHVFEVLMRLQARACQIASEVLVLLKSGHADGAHARWRSLHEIAVVGIFVESAGNEIAERYLFHDAIESYKAARQYQEHCASLGYEPISEEEFDEIKSAYQHLVDRFGPAYKADYGWAVPVIAKNRPSFRDVEERVGLDHLRPFYKLASHNVHANPKGIFHKLGLLRGGKDILLAGPSNFGLAEPGQGTAISLGQITVILLGTRSNMDTLVISNILHMLTRELGEEFVAAQMLLETEEFADPQRDV